jgi:hypothetical protein
LDVEVEVRLRSKKIFIGPRFFVASCEYICQYTHIMNNQSDIVKHRALFLDEVISLWPCIKGSVAQVRKPCARPTCPACHSGRKHAAYILSYRQGGKVRCRYVPREWVPLLRQAIVNGRRLEQRMAELSGELLEFYREQRTRKALNRVGRTKSAD